VETRAQAGAIEQSADKSIPRTIHSVRAFLDTFTSGRNFWPSPYGPAREHVPRRALPNPTDVNLAKLRKLGYDKTTLERRIPSSAAAQNADRNGKAPSSRIRAAGKRSRIFLLSPANASGLRAKMILESSERSALGARLRTEGASLGEIFTFISGLYFRGKLAYARAFADPPARVPGIAVITAAAGLVSPDEIFTMERLREISAAPIDPAEPRYRIPLLRDARRLLDSIGSRCDVVLLGSIATSKYVEPLLSVFGDRLLFPAEFAGRGDMSRGGLMLRCERAGVQLNYIPVSNAMRRGSRPPRLPKPAPFPGSRRAPSAGSQMEAVILIGVQGSGKTSFYREHFFNTHVRISLDMLRTRRRERILVAACLAAKQPFVIDNTNPLPSDRARYIAEAHRAGFRVVGYFFQTSLREAMQQNDQRSGKQKIPSAAVAGTFRKLQAPTLEEGLDAIRTVTISSDRKFIVTEGHGPGQS
jgi:predicted kinase